MKKIYSLVLLATTLLFSTNAWADAAHFTINDDATVYGTLTNAVNAASAGDVIKLSADGELSPYTDNNLISKSVTLDLNGHVLSISTNNVFLGVQAAGVTIQNGTVRSDNLLKFGLIRLNSAGASATLDNVKLSSTSTVDNYNLLTSAASISASVVINSNCQVLSDNKAGLFRNEGTMTFESHMNVPVAGSAAALTYINYGNVIISSGLFQGTLTIENHGTCVIEGGTFEKAVTFDGPNAVTVRDGASSSPLFKGTIAQAGSAAPILQGGTYLQGLNDLAVASGYSAIDLSTANAKRILEINANVAQIGSTKYQTLEAAFNAATDYQTITLLRHATITSTILIKDGRHITLDLDQFNVTGSIGSATLKKSPRLPLISIVRGHLAITGTGTIENTALGGHIVNISGVNYHVGVEGYNEATHKNWSSFTTGPNVTLHAGTCGIYVCSILNNRDALPSSEKFAHNTSTYMGKTEADKDKMEALGHNRNEWIRCSYGVNVTIDGDVYGGIYGIQVDGNQQAAPAEGQSSDSDNFPQVTINSTSEVWSIPTETGIDDQATGVYGGGYAIWTIKGYVHGSTGVYMKSGSVDIESATIASDNPTRSEIVGTGSGIQAGGSAIVIESNMSYPGAMEINISGETEVSASSGYAVEEVVTNATKDKVYDLKIESGEFNGGDAGCVIMTAELKEDVILNNGISGGTYNDDKISEYLDATTGLVGQTENENGETIYVINTKPAASDPFTRNINVDNGTAYIKWPNDTTVTLTQNARIVYFAMEGNSTLTIPTGKTLRAGSIVMGADAAIIVEPGGVLELDSASGLVANKVGNIILQANFTEAANLIMSPQVKSNTQPKATVQLATPQAYQIDADNAHWQRFASPMGTLEGFASDASTVSHAPYYPGHGNNLWTWFKYWNYNTSGWADVTNLATVEPFVGYFLSNNRLQADNDVHPNGVIYTMKGRLMGSLADQAQARGIGFNFFGNSYTAPMDIAAILAEIEAQSSDLEHSIWIFDPSSQSFDGYNSANSIMWDYSEIKPLDAFVCKLNEGATNIIGINTNYEATVWNPYVAKQISPAPAVRKANKVNTTCAQIVFNGMSGAQDKLILIEDANYTNTFDNGADISKYMNDNNLNVFADGKVALSTVATDNLNGTMLSMQTRDDEQYSLSFKHVNGEVLYIKDMLTGIITEISEGNTYQFVAQSNADVKNRFQIISSKNAPTALDEVSAAHAAKGIYTVLGQYLGASDELDKLPKGVYVVDGVKIVK